MKTTARFMFRSSREVAAAIGALIRQKRPQAGYFNYIQESTDGIMSESNTAVDRPLPLWPYSASDNVNRARNSQPGKMAVNLNMQFVDFWWRFATVPRQEIALRSWQNMAHGGALTFEVNGTLDLQDRQALETVKPIFRWAAANQQYYVGQSSAARVLLLGAPAGTGRAYNQNSYRGMFRLLSEEHIPFAVSDNLDWMGKRGFDVVIATDWAPAALRPYVEGGGKLLIASAVPPEFEVAAVERTEPDVKGYIRIRDHAAFPSLRDTDLLLLNGPFTTLKTSVPPALTLVPPSMIGPPEFVHIDMHDTGTAALASVPVGKGTGGVASVEPGGSLLPAQPAGSCRPVPRPFRPPRAGTPTSHRRPSAGGNEPDAARGPDPAAPDQSQRPRRNRLFRPGSHGGDPCPHRRRIPFRPDRALARRAAGPARRAASPEFTIPRLNDYELVVLN